jgi:glycosyltransferase involved in cell wall biosynthesis
MIGFAIPFFKGHAFLKEAIESVRAQTSPAWRLWVSDEGVESGTQNLVESFQDSRISYHRNPRPLGMVGNWNRCLDLATTEQTTLLHSDDRLLPNYTEIMNRGFAQFPNATALFCQTQIIDGKSMPVFSFPDFYKKKLLPTSTPFRR